MEVIARAHVRGVGEPKRRFAETDAERGIQVGFVPLVAGQLTVAVEHVRELGVKRIPGADVDGDGLDGTIAHGHGNTDIGERPD